MQRSFSVRASGFCLDRQSRLQDLHELHGANAGGGRFDEGRGMKAWMQENVADLLLAVAGTRFDYEMKTARQGLAQASAGADAFIFRRFVRLPGLPL